MAKKYNIPVEDNYEFAFACEALVEYARATRLHFRERRLFDDEQVEVEVDDIRVVELFAGVGGFRVGLENASTRYKTIWNNQWEPSTKRQDASIAYCRNFGIAGHCNEDINTVETERIPNCDLLCGGFPCQDYSVATTLARSGGIEGKKGVLWWQIYRILNEKGRNRPRFLMLENVDRLLSSPASQRGRDFAIILASLSDLGYDVEWRVINAADYGMPQRRRRTYIMGYRRDSRAGRSIRDSRSWVLENGVMAHAFPCAEVENTISEFSIDGDITVVSESFNKGGKVSPFGHAGIMRNRHVYSVDVKANYYGPFITLGQILINENDVPEDFFISAEDLPKWKFQKGAKSLERTSKNGHSYLYTEGAMAFPDALDRASRTIITGEGGPGPSRFKHIVLCPSGRYRRLVPVELERLNMFPDNHTQTSSPLRRAFLMGNALVTGIPTKLGLALLRYF